MCPQELIFSNGVSLGVLAMHSRTGPAPVVSKHKADSIFAGFCLFVLVQFLLLLILSCSLFVCLFILMFASLFSF